MKRIPEKVTASWPEFQVVSHLLCQAQACLHTAQRNPHPARCVAEICLDNVTSNLSGCSGTFSTQTVQNIPVFLHEYMCACPTLNLSKSRVENHLKVNWYTAGSSYPLNSKLTFEVTVCSFCPWWLWNGFFFQMCFSFHCCFYCKNFT